MCRYILPPPADTITPVLQGFFVTCGLCQTQSHIMPRPRTTLKAKDLMHQGQGRTNITGIDCLEPREIVKFSKRHQADVFGLHYAATSLNIDN